MVKVICIKDCKSNPRITVTITSTNSNMCCFGVNYQIPNKHNNEDNDTIPIYKLDGRFYGWFDSEYFITLFKYREKRLNEILNG